MLAGSVGADATAAHVGTGLPWLSIRGGSAGLARHVCSRPIRWPSSWVRLFCSSARHCWVLLLVCPFTEIAK